MTGGAPQPSGAAGQGPAWRLTAEIGPVGQAPSPFSYPSVVQPTAAGCLLVVDRRRPANRLVELDGDGRTVWSFAAPPRMNFAHRLDPERVLYTQENTVRVVDRAGRVQLLADLAGRARFDAGCVAGELVYVGGDDGIDVLTLDGRHRRHLPASDTTFRNPVDIDVLPDGGLLIADGWTSAVVELGPDGQRRAVFGRWRSPGRDGGRLNVPKSACRLASGATLVADTMSHRLVEYAPGGEMTREVPVRAAGGLFAPAFVREVAGGLLLVADTGNRRVLLLRPDGTPARVVGPPRPPRRVLSLPRSAVPTGGDGVLVCDACNDRVVEVGPDGQERWAFGRGSGCGQDAGMRIPRTATVDAAGLVHVADGLNGRVLVADRSGQVRREIAAVRVGTDRTPLEDPHLAVGVGEHLLVVDSDLQRVFLLDGDDRAVRVWGGRGELSDPHTAVLRADGSLLVSDSGNRRVVAFDPAGEVVLSLDATSAPSGGPAPLGYPRFADFAAGDDLIVADSDGARVVRCDRSGVERWAVGPTVALAPQRAHALPEFRVTRWAALDARGRLLVTDYWGSRVAVLEASAGTRGGQPELPSSGISMSSLSS